MKAKELMVGDYVLVRPSMMPIQVAAIHKKKVAYHATGDRLTWVRDGLIEPIPITPEILEKNGFKMKQKEGESNFEYVAAGERYIIEFLFFRETIYNVSTLLECELGFSGGLDRIHKCNVRFVHELQHALRLCGIEKEIVL